MMDSYIEVPVKDFGGTTWVHAGRYAGPVMEWVPATIDDLRKGQKYRIVSGSGDVSEVKTKGGDNG